MNGTLEKQAQDSDPRIVAAHAAIHRIEARKTQLEEKINTLKDAMREATASGVNRQALAMLQEKEIPQGARALLDAITTAKDELLITDRALTLARQRVDQVMIEISAEQKPAIADTNRRFIRRRLNLMLEAARLVEAQERFLSELDRKGIRGLPSQLWPAELGLVADPNSVIRARLREAIGAGHLTEDELRRVLNGGDLKESQ